MPHKKLLSLLKNSVSTDLMVISCVFETKRERKTCKREVYKNQLNQNVFSMRTIKQWNSWAREPLQSPPLKAVKTQAHKTEKPGLIWIVIDDYSSFFMESWYQSNFEDLGFVIFFRKVFFIADSTYLICRSSRFSNCNYIFIHTWKAILSLYQFSVNLHNSKE